jgi:hypothetical protein
MEGKFSIVLFRDGGEGAGIEHVLERHDLGKIKRWTIDAKSFGSGFFIGRICKLRLP